MFGSRFSRALLAASLAAGVTVAAIGSSTAGAQVAAPVTAGSLVVLSNTVFPPRGIRNFASTGVSVTGNEAGLMVTLTAADGEVFTLAVAPKAAATFAANNAEETNTAAVATASQAGMTLARSGSACNSPTGTFTVEAAGFPGALAAVTRVAVRFEISCAGDRPLTAAGVAFWQQVPGPFKGEATSEFTSMTPARLLDTRVGSGTGNALGAGGTATIDVTVDQNGNLSGVPAGAQAVVVNLTAINPVHDPAQGTFLSLYPAGGSRPLVSNLNPKLRDTVANLATVKVGAANSITLYNEAGSSDAVIDVVGFYVADNAAAGGGRYVSQAPVRKLDTRLPDGGPTPLAPGETRSIDLGVGADAAVINITVTAPTAGGYVTVFPDGSATVPNVSNVNFVAGQTVANLAVVKLDAGRFKIYNPAGTTHVVIDLMGTYVLDPDGVSGAGRFVPLDPQRVFDQREFSFTTPGNDRFQISLLNRLRTWPFAYQAVVTNITVTNTNTAGYLTVYPRTGSVPVSPTSNVNWLAGETRANQVMAGVDAHGITALYHGVDPGQTASVQFIIDAAGLFTQ